MFCGPLIIPQSAVAPYELGVSPTKLYDHDLIYAVKKVQVEHKFKYVQVEHKIRCQLGCSKHVSANFNGEWPHFSWWAV